MLTAAIIMMFVGPAAIAAVAYPEQARRYARASVGAGKALAGVLLAVLATLGKSPDRLTRADRDALRLP